jgi:hypothetical protein
MNDSIIKEIGRSYIVSSLVPATLAVLLSTVIFRDFLPPLDTPERDTFLYFESIVGLLVSLTIWLAFALYSSQDYIVKFFEGYYFPHWSFLINRQRRKNQRVQKKITALHKERERLTELITNENHVPRKVRPRVKEAIAKQKYSVEKLRNEVLANLQELETNAPYQVNDLLPTNLGNVFRASEVYAQERYGIDGVTLWPRLAHVLPAEFAANMEEQNNRLMFLLNSSLLALFLAITCLVILAVGVLLPISISVMRYLIISMSLFVTGYFIYRASIGTAQDFVLFVRSGCDLYRFDLLVQLNLCLPHDLEQERDLWKKVKEFFVAGQRLGPLIFDYEHNKSLKKRGAICPSDDEEE